MRGRPGEPVSLSVKHAGDSKPVAMTIEREIILVQSIKGDVPDINKKVVDVNLKVVDINTKKVVKTDCDWKLPGLFPPVKGFPEVPKLGREYREVDVCTPPIQERLFFNGN